MTEAKIPGSGKMRILVVVLTVVTTTALELAIHRLSPALVVWGWRIPLALLGAAVVMLAGAYVYLRISFKEQLAKDLHERGQIEDALRESETKYRIVAENTRDWEFWLSPEGKVIYTSPSCKRVTGHSAKEFKEDPDLLLRLIHPEDLAKFVDHRRQVEHRAVAGEYEFRMVYAGGAIRWIAHTCQPVFRDGHFLGTRGSNRDVTERKLSEQILFEQKELYRLLTETSPDLIFLCRRGGHIFYANPSACRHVGLSLHEVTGKTMFDLFPGEAAERYTQHIESVFETGEPMHLSGLENLPGTAIWIDARLVPVRDLNNQVFAVLGVSRDVTAQKMSTEALADSERRYRAVVEDQTELICRFLPDGTLTFVNEAYCRYFRRNRDELLGVSFFPVLPPQDLARLQAELSGLSRERPVSVLEHRVFNSDGSIGWQQWTDRAIYDERGQLKEYQSVGRDITERKRLEERLEKLSEEEKQRLGRDLHDGLGQLLSGIAFRSKALEGRLAENGDDLAREAGEITNLIDLAVVNTRDMARMLVPVELERLGLVTALQSLAEFTSLHTEIPCSYVGRMNVPLTDPTKAIHLFRIAQEAVNNAVKHSRATEVLIDLYDDKDRICLGISDNGVGLHGVWDGQGMGLAVMRRRADMIGANLRIGGNNGQGTAVTCCWPKKRKGAGYEE